MIGFPRAKQGTTSANLTCYLVLGALSCCSTGWYPRPNSAGVYLVALHRGQNLYQADITRLYFTYHCLVFGSISPIFGADGRSGDRHRHSRMVRGWRSGELGRLMPCRRACTGLGVIWVRRRCGRGSPAEAVLCSAGPPSRPAHPHASATCAGIFQTSAWSCSTSIC